MKVLWWLFLLLFFPSSPEGKEQNGSSIAVGFTPKPTSVSWKNIAIAVEGFIGCAGNLFIIIAIATNKALRRKELIIIAGLALSEFMLSFASLSAGVRRGWLEVTGFLGQPTTPSHCMWVIHSPFFTVGSPFQSLMWVIVSLDRLLAIKAPLWYWKQRNKYAYICVSLAGSLSAVYLFAGIIGSYFKPTNAAVKLVCYGVMPLPELLAKLHAVLYTTASWASMLIYALVVYFFREHGKTLPIGQPMKAHLKLQRQMTKTLGICVLITIVTVFTGTIVRLVLMSLRGTLIRHRTYYTYIPLIAIFMNINTIVNVFVFSYRQREIRAASICILTCGRVKLNDNQSSMPPGRNRVTPQPEA